MGIIGNAFIGYKRVYGIGGDRIPFLEDSIFYFDLSNPNSYTLGDTTIIDLSPSNNNLTVINALSNLREGKDGNITWIKNNNPDAGYGYLSLQPEAIIDADFSSTGVSMNFWLKPQTGHNPNNPPYGTGWPQAIFGVNVGGISPFNFTYTATPASGYSTRDSIGLSLGQKTDSNESAEKFSYDLGPSPTNITDVYRLFSFVWDCGNSYTMYLDGVQIKTGSTSKSWDNEVNSLTTTGAGLGNNGNAAINVGKSTTGMAVAQKLTSDQIAAYWNITKEYYGR